MRTSTGAPFVVAHRAGNDIERLRTAERLRVSLVEADVHLFGGRLEVRHRKTVGPIPILWDRWELAPPWAPRMPLDELLSQAADSTELMLDLKGHDQRLPARVLDAVDGHVRDRLTVCSQDWSLLEPFASRTEIRVVHSVGNARQLARLRRLGGSLAGVSIHQRLLDAAVVTELRRRADVVLSWPVETVAQARRLEGWGVNGLISRHFEQLTGALA